MRFELCLFREDRQQWAFADIEIDDASLALFDEDGKRKFMAQEIVPYIEAMQELK